MARKRKHPSFHHPSNHPTSPQMVQKQISDQTVIQLRKEGKSLDEIATVFSVTRQAVHQRLSKALQEFAKESLNSKREVLALELERLDELYLTARAKAVTGNIAAIDSCLRVMDRRAKLLGLDAPKKIEIGEIDPDELCAEIDAAAEAESSATRDTTECDQASVARETSVSGQGAKYSNSTSPTGDRAPK